MKRITTLSTSLFVAAALIVPACGGGAEDAPSRAVKATPKPPEAKKPEEPAEPEKDLSKATDAAELANKIQADPEKLEGILEAAGTTPEDFDKVLFEVAEDPDLAEAYADARTPMPDEGEGEGEDEAEDG